MVTGDRLPTFVYVGMGRSGSSLLWRVLQRHPDIFLAKEAEVKYFNRRFDLGLDWYTSRFENHKNEKHIGDITPGYYKSEECIRRLHGVLGSDTKIIINFRNPVGFYFSRYAHIIRAHGKPSGTFDDLLRAERVADRIKTAVETLLSLFGRSNILFMCYEQNIKRRDPSFEQIIYRFLEIDDSREYYDESRDTSVNTAEMPQYIYNPADKAIELNFDEDVYLIPTHSLMFCAPRKFTFWRNPDPVEAQGLIESQQSWKRGLDREEIQRLYESEVLPLKQFLETTCNLNLDTWDDQPDRISYKPARPHARFLQK